MDGDRARHHRRLVRRARGGTGPADGPDAGARRNLARDGFEISPCSPPRSGPIAGDLAQDPYAAEIFLDGGVARRPGFRLSTPVSPTRSTESVRPAATSSTPARSPRAILAVTGPGVGGWMTSADLAGHAGAWVDPVATAYRVRERSGSCHRTRRASPRSSRWRDGAQSFGASWTTPPGCTSRSRRRSRAFAFAIDISRSRRDDRHRRRDPRSGDRRCAVGRLRPEQRRRARRRCPATRSSWPRSTATGSLCR